MKRNILLLTMFMTALIFSLNTCAAPVYAAETAETLTVSAAWADGDLLKIRVTDKNGADSALALRLPDYTADNADSEYISIQAVDLDGNTSKTVQVKNPYYTAADDEIIGTTESASESEAIPDSEFFDAIFGLIAPETTEESSVPDEKPFTPDGSGTVMDNATDGGGKEFFTLETEQGSIFYLIVDRQRTSDNIYFLNAVTEDDLAALAQKNGVESNAVPSTTQAAAAAESTTSAPESTTALKDEVQAETGGFDSKAIIFIAVAVIGAGGAAYYFKIYKNRDKKSADDDGDFDDYDENPFENGGDE